MISVDKEVLNRLKEAPSALTYKIFLHIALNQPEEGIFGFRTTKMQLAIDLNLKIRTIFDSLKWLKENLLIQELKQVDEVEFMCNPRWVMNNSDFQARKNEWNRRQRLDIERELRIDEERIVRQLRKERKLKRSAKN